MDKCSHGSDFLNDGIRYTFVMLIRDKETRLKAILFLICLTVSIGALAGEVAKVIGVIDGNTIQVETPQQGKHIVVIDGIDSPEAGQEFAEQAKLYLEKRLLDKKVTITYTGKDRTGNFLAIVMVAERDIRYDLLKEGLTWVAEKNTSGDLEPYQSWAQQKGRGLWKSTKPVPPWQYRRQQSMARPKSS